MKAITTLVASLTLISLSARAEDAPKQTSNSIDFASFHSPDNSEWSAGIKWNLEWEHKGDWQFFRAASSGAWAADESLNQTPIIGQFNAGGWFKLLGDTIGRDEDPLSDEALSHSSTKIARMDMSWGATGRYETDQGREHSNGVASAFLGLSNTNRFNAYALIPSLYASIDAVFPDRNATIGTAGAAGDSYGRFYAAANWELYFETFGEADWLKRMRFHGAMEYRQAFNAPAALAASGQDQGFAYLAELLYELDSGVNFGGTHKAPMFLFVQYASGKFAPEPTKQERLIAGVRFKF